MIGLLALVQPLVAVEEPIQAPTPEMPGVGTLPPPVLPTPLAKDVSSQVQASPPTPALPPSFSPTPLPIGAANADTAPRSKQSPQAVSNGYATRPRIPEEMRDVAQQAAELFQLKRYDEAAAHYQEIIAKYPDCLFAWSNLGVVRYQQGTAAGLSPIQHEASLVDALKALLQAVKLSSDDAFSHRNLGIVYFRLGRDDVAIEALQHAVALEPNDAVSHDYLGVVDTHQGRIQAAAKEFSTAVAIDDNLAEAHDNLAVIYASERPPALTLARQQYQRALELGVPRNPQVEKLLGSNSGR